MTDPADPVARAVWDACHLTGTFTLRSGRTATEYFDKYRFEADPALLRSVVERMVPLVPAGTQVLAGLEMGGIAIATVLSARTGLPAAFVRKAAKPYGTARLAEGTDVAGLARERARLKVQFDRAYARVLEDTGEKVP